MMRFSISATTRERRPNEVEGVDYYFLTPEQFRAKIENQEFLEWEEVYKDRYYGTLKSEVQRILDNDNVALFDVDVEGGLNIKRQYGRQLLDVFVMPPSVDELHRRLVSRATESEESLIKRLSKAESELKYAYKFNTVIVNVVLQDAFNEAEKLVREFLEDEIPDSDTQDN
jgi:guanylate kinase